MKLKRYTALTILSAAMFATGCGDTVNNYYGEEGGSSSNNGGDKPVVSDTTENTKERCSDGVDNDKNGKADCEDAGCAEFAFCQKAEDGKENTLAACSDGIDNDGDGDKDCDDSECKQFTICQEKVAENTEALCKDGLDNDGDGSIDCDDSECKAFSMCAASTEENTISACSDSIDNDGDGLVDCDDPQCFGFAICKDSTAAKLDKCTDGIDNDKDGALDCEDSDCWGLAICADLISVKENTIELCTDGLDNDFNGVMDDADPNCEIILRGGGEYGENTYELCKDGLDNDGDGKKDCADPECGVYDICQASYSKDKDECPDDPFKVVKDKCGCGQTLVGEDCYINVASADEFKAITGTGKYIIKQPIDFGEAKLTSITGFKGTLYGANQRITGVFNQDSTNVCGLFSTLDGATISDLNLALTLNCNIESGSKNVLAGVLAGTITNSTITNINGSSKLLLDAKITLQSVKNTDDMTTTIKAGSIAGDVQKSQLSKLDIRGNVTTRNGLGTKTEFTYTTSAFGTTNQVTMPWQTIQVGGVVGSLDADSKLSDVVAYANVTANLNALKIADTYTYCTRMSDLQIKTSSNGYYIGGIVGYSDADLENVANYGTVKTEMNAGFYTRKVGAASSSSCSGAKCSVTIYDNAFVGGIVGQTNKSISSAKMVGKIITDGYFKHEEISYEYAPTYTTKLRAGGIAGLLSGPSIDTAFVDVDLEIAPLANTNIGGVVARSNTENSFTVSNSTVFANLVTKLGVFSANYAQIWGAGVGVSRETTAYLLNNYLYTHYNQKESYYPASGTRVFSQTVGRDEDSSSYEKTKTSVVVNNYLDYTHDYYESDTTWMKPIIKGEYVYETYWNNKSGTPSTSDVSHLDASAGAYTYNKAGIPVMRTNESVLGLLRYNSGHNGGVLSTNIPASRHYSDWTTIADSEGHTVPVPSDSLK